MGVGMSPAKVRSPTKKAARQPAVITIDEDENENDETTTSPIKPATTTTAMNTTTSSSTTQLPSSTTSTAHFHTQKPKRTFSRVVSNGSSMTQKPFKVPRKVGKVNPEVVMGGAVKKRSVLADIVNEVLSQGD